MDKYTIYLVNASANPQLFWCFLERPDELAGVAGVFANSKASLMVKPKYSGKNRFRIPVQYVVGAGASNDAVGLNVEVISDTTHNADLGQIWDADYVTAPPNEGPDLTKDSAAAGPHQIAIKSNNFNKVQNETSENSWFSNQSFGIMTEAGFVGMTWSPDPGKTRTLTPKLTFYVAVGSYGANKLADWTDISNSAQKLEVPDDFDDSNECTVTYGQDGTWQPSKGRPQKARALVEESKALAILDKSRLAGKQTHQIVATYWPSEPDPKSIPGLVGMVTVSQALNAAFAFFVLSSVEFSVDRIDEDGKTVHFSYSGSQGAKQIMNLFKKGAQLIFS
jgi:hypothetical protein